MNTLLLRQINGKNSRFDSAMMDRKSFSKLKIRMNNKELSGGFNHDRTEKKQWFQSKFSVDEILKRDKTSLDIFWIKDRALADLDNLPDLDELAGDIIENLQSALESFQELQKQLK